MSAPDCDPLTPYQAITNGIKVCVTPSFIGAEPEDEPERFVWAYAIEIENLSDITVQLTAREWVIIDRAGRQQIVTGPGVVGEQPILQPGDCFAYQSGCPLSTPSGLMSGHYKMRTETGETFLAQIPPFSLDSPYDMPTLN